MVYIIRVTINGKYKYIYTAAAPVDVMESAHKFYSGLMPKGIFWLTDLRAP